MVCIDDVRLSDETFAWAGDASVALSVLCGVPDTASWALPACQPPALSPALPFPVCEDDEDDEDDDFEYFDDEDEEDDELDEDDEFDDDDFDDEEDEDDEDDDDDF